MIHLVCFGNLWQGDDGFGIHVLQRLRMLADLPPEIRLFEGGLSGLAALEFFEGCEKVILVDAMKSGRAIGEVRRLSREEIEPPEACASLHDFAVNHLLAALPVMFAGRRIPEVVLIGAEIGEVRPFTDQLSPEIALAVEQAIQLCRDEINAGLV